MEDKTALEILKEGTETRNSWRSQNLLQLPDFRRADLTGAILTEEDLQGAIR